MSEAELANTAWWSWFWSEIEHWAFLAVVVFLAIEFAALKYGAPYKDKIEKNREVVVADAIARTKEAELALAKYKQPRSLDIDSFLATLKGARPAKVQVLYVRECSDCSWTAQFIGSFLNTANWNAEWGPIDEKAAASGPWRLQPSAVSVKGYPWGITVVAKDITDEALKLPFGISVETLRDALWKSYQPAVTMAFDRDMPPDLIRVVVAPKP